MEEHELHSFTSAISHAFAQPNAEFLSMSGALPMFERDGEVDIADIGLPLLSSCED
jgi:hypothetical protein